MNGKFQSNQILHSSMTKIPRPKYLENCYFHGRRRCTHYGLLERAYVCEQCVEQLFSSRLGFCQVASITKKRHPRPSLSHHINRLFIYSETHLFVHHSKQFLRIYFENLYVFNVWYVWYAKRTEHIYTLCTTTWNALPNESTKKF